MTDKLTHKQALFVQEYLIDLNATQAAIRAGYSEDTAGQIGNENLRKPQIEKAVNQAIEAQVKRTQITADRVLNELAKLAFYNMKDFIAEDGEPRSVDELEVDAAAAIRDIETTHFEGGKTTKLKLADKGQNLERLGKHLKLFTDKQEIEHTGLPKVLIRSYTTKKNDAASV